MRYIISPVYHWSAPRSYTSLDMLETPHLKGVYNANWSDAIWLFSVWRSSDSTLSSLQKQLTFAILFFQPSIACGQVKVRPTRFKTLASLFIKSLLTLWQRSTKATFPFRLSLILHNSVVHILRL